MRRGYGNGLGADPITDVVSSAVERALVQMEPRLREMVAKASEAAQPTVSRVLREDVMPYVVGGLALGAAVAALIGSWMATRR